jgi:SPP1 gp7 family putative phage head morphogenesis protein
MQFTKYIRQLFKGNKTAEPLYQLVKTDKQNRLSYQLKRTSTPMAKAEMSQWKRAIASATDPERPDRNDLYALYQLAMSDAHLFSQVNSRKIKSLGAPFHLIKAGKADDGLTELLKRPWFGDFMSLALDSIFFGHSLIEFGELKDRHFESVHLIDRNLVIPEKGLVVVKVGDDKGFPYREAPFNEYLIEIGSPDHLGLLKDAVPEVIWKRNARSDWSVRSEKFGMPVVVIRTSSTDTRELDAKEMMASSIGSNGYAILHIDDQVEFHESQHSDAYQVYLEQARFCDEQLSKLILGQTGVSDKKSFVGAAEVHERMMNEYIERDMRWLENIVNYQLFPFLISKGYPLNDARFAFDEPDAEAKQSGGAGAKKPNSPGKLSWKPGIKNLATPNASTDKRLIELATAIHSGKLPKETTSPELALNNGDSLWRRIKANFKKIDHIDKSPENESWLRVQQNNVYAFGLAKSFAQMQEMRAVVHDQNGVQRSFSEFYKHVKAIDERYNQHYAQAEYQAVVRGTIMGQKWLEIQEQRDVFPWLQYQTKGDGRVRAEHDRLNGIVLPVDDPFWSAYYPPNGWRCRCSVKPLTDAQLEKQNLKPADSDVAKQAAEMEVKDNYWKNNAGMTELFDRNGTPYFKAMPSQGELPLKAVQNYGMPSVERIYERSTDKLPIALGFESENDFKTFWSQKADQNGDIKLKDSTGLTFTFSEMLRDQTIEKGNWNVAKSAFVLLKNSNEVWGALDTKQNVFRKYIGYYQRKPLVLLADQHGVVSDFHQWDQSLADLEKLREGLLIKKK